MILKVSSPQNMDLPVSQGEVRVKVLAENDSPVLIVEGGIVSDGSTSPSISISTSTSTSFSSSYPSSPLLKRKIFYERLTEDMLSIKIVSTPIMYTTENVPLFINNTSIRDIDCSDSTFLRLVLTPINGNVSIHLPKNDPLKDRKSVV